jgi:hypothetical protein
MYLRLDQNTFFHVHCNQLIRTFFFSIIEKQIIVAIPKMSKRSASLIYRPGAPRSGSKLPKLNTTTACLEPSLLVSPPLRQHVAAPSGFLKLCSSFSTSSRPTERLAYPP